MVLCGCVGCCQIGFYVLISTPAWYMMWCLAGAILDMFWEENIFLDQLTILEWSVVGLAVVCHPSSIECVAQWCCEHVPCGHLCYQCLLGP